MEIEEKLNSFISKDKFSDEIWEERGLIPSDHSTIKQMSDVIDSLAKRVKNAYQTGKTKESIKKILEKEIKNVIGSLMFDTEEREFLGDLIYDLAGILEIELDDDSEDRIAIDENLENQKQKCDYCSVYLSTLIMAKTKEVNYSAWDIVKCDNCAGLNLLSLDPYIERCIGQGYEFVKQLDKEKYDEEAALKVLEKMRKKTGR